MADPSSTTPAPPPLDATKGGDIGASSSSHPNPPPPAAATTSAPAQATTKAIIKNVDMAEEMQQQVIDLASDALTKFSVEKDIAAHVKRTMDQKFGPTWHAVVGKNYGSYVTHETKHFIYFYLGQIAFLLWRA